MSLQTFLEKSRRYKQNKKQSFTMEIEDFGSLTLVRPTGRFKDSILDYYEDLNKNMRTIGKDEDGKDITEFISFKDLNIKASKLVYLCCPEMQEEEVVKDNGNDNFRVPLEIFGIKVTNIASKILEEFEGVKEKKEVEDDIKN